MSADIFTRIHRSNFWNNEESRSGPGSSLKQTTAIREKLPDLLYRHDINSMLDIPCGDFHWMSQTKLPADFTYIGADIVPELILSNKQRHPGEDFQLLDIINDSLPKVDLVLVRDCLGHFSNINVIRALDNIHRSGSTYLLATHFTDPKWAKHPNIKDGQWRPVNLSLQFGLGKPLEIIDEQNTVADGAFADKTLALWRINK